MVTIGNLQHNVSFMGFVGGALPSARKANTNETMSLSEKLAMMELSMREIAEEIETRPGMLREDNEEIRSDPPNC